MTAVSRASARPLVIGYGNTLRSDDGAGRDAADALAADPRLAGAEVLARTQLTPELAQDISAASSVVFIDASTIVPPGAVTVRTVAPAAGPSPWTHHVTPESLLALAESLYGRVPPATIVSIGAVSLELGDALTAAVAAALPAALEAVIRIVGEPIAV